MTNDEIKYTIDALRYNCCQLCLGNDNAVYQKMCRKPRDKDDCKLQSKIDKLENELFRK